MAKNNVLLRGGLWNHEDWDKFEKWVSENVFYSSNPKLGIKCGDHLSKEDVSKAAQEIYYYRQERSGKGSPSLNESQALDIVSEDTGYSS